MRKRVELPAVIALGSNLGDREQTLRDAVRELAAVSGVVVQAASGIVETPAQKPDGIDESAPSYLNAVVLVRSALSPERLLEQLQRIEHELGRVRAERWGDRTIDLDLIDFAGLSRDTAELTLPHPRAWQRAFVLAPWSQVQPDAVLHGHGRVADLVKTAADPVADYPARPLAEEVSA
jgi:2-amino-4-hydroxy-6-hydroxymethyldihydropteridine diphosphokinase